MAQPRGANRVKMRSRVPRRWPIVLNIYHVGPFENLNTVLSPMGIGGFHTGVEIAGAEYTYAKGAGVFEHEPRNPRSRGLIAAYAESVDLGHFDGPWKHVQGILGGLAQKFNSDSYDLVSSNCNHFVDAFCIELLGEPLPAHLNRLAGLGSGLRFLMPTGITSEAPSPPTRKSTPDRDNTTPKPASPDDIDRELDAEGGSNASPNSNPNPNPSPNPDAAAGTSYMAEFFRGLGSFAPPAPEEPGAAPLPPRVPLEVSVAPTPASTPAVSPATAGNGDVDQIKLRPPEKPEKRTFLDALCSAVGMYDDDDDEAATTASKEKKPPSTASPERQPHRPRKSATERMLEQQGVQLTLGWQFLPPPLAPITPEVSEEEMDQFFMDQIDKRLKREKRDKMRRSSSFFSGMSLGLSFNFNLEGACCANDDDQEYTGG